MEPHVSFILASTKLGPMIFNRFDFVEPEPGFQAGVGAQLFFYGDFDEASGIGMSSILDLRRKIYGDNVIVLDLGANIGAHTIRWARYMDGWGKVFSFEPQERVYYALAGNIALNNLFNASAMHAAVGDYNGVIRMPTLNHSAAANFGGLSLKVPDDNLGQPLSMTERLTDVRILKVDSLYLPRVDFMKIDVEGMEVEVINGACETIRDFRPVIYAEHSISGLDNIKAALPGYTFMIPTTGERDNVLCVHEEDKILEIIRSA